MGIDAIEIIPFTPEDWQMYKAIRLHALQSDPKSFGSPYAKEKSRPDDMWREGVSRADVAIFGVYHYGDLIGMTGAALLADADGGKTVKLWGSWLEPSWRGKGVSEKMYEARLNWARAQPDVRRVIVSHRESNIASKKANQKHGFIPTHQDDRDWPDGAIEPEVFYELVLRR
jgi:RimJ/RimL family protein N-acetyltransferase